MKDCNVSKLTCYNAKSSANKEIGRIVNPNGRENLKFYSLCYKKFTNNVIHNLNNKGLDGSPYLTPIRIYIGFDKKLSQFTFTKLFVYIFFINYKKNS